MAVVARLFISAKRRAGFSREEATLFKEMVNKASTMRSGVDPTTIYKHHVCILSIENTFSFHCLTLNICCRYGPKDISMMIYDYKVSTLVCGGGDGPHVAKAIVKKFLEFRKGAVCHCG